MPQRTELTTKNILAGSEWSDNNTFSRIQSDNPHFLLMMVLNLAILTEGGVESISELTQPVFTFRWLVEI